MFWLEGGTLFFQTLLLHLIRMILNMARLYYTLIFSQIPGTFVAYAVNVILPTSFSTICQTLVLVTIVLITKRRNSLCFAFFST